MGREEGEVMDNFWDKVKGGWEQSVSTVNLKAQEVQLSAELRSLKRQRETSITQLGQAAYDAIKSRRIEAGELSQGFQSVVEFDSKITEKEGNLKQVESQIRSVTGRDTTESVAHCPHCGTGLREQTRFCAGCGKDVEAVVMAAIKEREAARALDVCSCGAILAADAKFCSDCGKTVEHIAPDTVDVGAQLNSCECGEQLPPGASFCGSCGHRVSETKSSSRIPASEDSPPQHENGTEELCDIETAPEGD
ncbi:MAG: hypothetical protein AUJ92_11880 [Armatimonadetes bacterium CG2_30_59_28]|nr:MAG: hypothetical protein AUJ92_11880 [Armatimonadetes bacterium CG2_30_59_28]PIU64070.1 MAG: hypothetical protein COS85_13810 [Armatimonadetes bacterium CG07_land_8_20_14_0_80_59_28]PIX42140.1 MAG: hypothetical protein COZ56_10070 [Armatimonadetes bacterium CG_4_8_14_3_um_filter_58_9]PIY43023.1 MAG: hypothetical protein COZ05_12380 [Armatimonadetes bacterium CG_4_10_14_3_um_filter_59_10]PJB63607.1 MAG: hypothetical protein CO095_16185 [Armatimonadetes bacterium CG_4_9_14_3_um_filter_58_7]